jgi:hypothetical protein
MFKLFKFKFDANLAKFTPELRTKFIVNSIDEEMISFFDGCEPGPLRFLKHWFVLDYASKSDFEVRFVWQGLLRALSLQDFDQWNSS